MVDYYKIMVYSNRYFKVSLFNSDDSSYDPINANAR